MLASIRSALLTIAVLTATIMAPAQAGSTGEPLIPFESASLPKVSVPELIDPQGEPQLTDSASKPDDSAARDEDDEPAVAPGADLASMVAQLRSSNPGSRELECLAIGIYFEAKSEPLAGQLAVGQVIANRAESRGRFPSTYCGVLFQRGQFSFVRGRSVPPVPRASKQWQTAVAIAKIVDRDLKESAVGNALFFHARYVSPQWKLKRVAAIGNHIFYR
ncbi:MAG TPA: cell wall hydrolase [Sphingomicrobium sp.]|nr:cell wall hydrolase [Sphingomicrobium sp.]